MEVSKVCSKCKMEKSLNEFYKDNSTRAGIILAEKRVKVSKRRNSDKNTQD